jgi:uncharacterized protein YggT (Ycf19 family)
MRSLPADQTTQPFAPIYAPIEAEPEPRSNVAGRIAAVFTTRLVRTLYVAGSIVETLIAIRVLLRLLVANPGASFTGLIYGLTAPLVLPFQGVFTDLRLNGGVLELSSLLAILVYALAARILARIIGIAR